uniref:DEAQ-box RNA dependent ATPase 1 n=1 Tax=Eptatretus burgeri TaxID=7764 RepID=A0A8C4PZP2_EPTBU
MTESTDLKSSASSPEIIDLSFSLSNVAPLEITRRKIGQLNVDYNGCFMTDDSDDANHRSFSNDSMINNSTTNVLASDHSPSNTNLSIGVAQPADWFGKAGILTTSVDSANNLEETESRKNLPPGDVQEGVICGSGDEISKNGEGMLIEATVGRSHPLDGSQSVNKSETLGSSGSTFLEVKEQGSIDICSGKNTSSQSVRYLDMYQGCHKNSTSPEVGPQEGNSDVCQRQLSADEGMTLLNRELKECIAKTSPVAYHSCSCPTDDGLFQALPAERCSDAVSDRLPPADALEHNPFDGLPYSSRFYSLLEARRALPIWHLQHAFRDALERNPIVLVSGSAGVGKSTQIPQWCTEFALSRGFDAGYVLCAVPHAAAPSFLAMRLADEMDLNLGHEVAFSVGVDDCTGPDTMLRFCTDEALLRELTSDPSQGGVAVMVLDELQERSLASAVLVGLAPGLVCRRPELRVVLIADEYTISNLERHFPSAPCIHVPPRPGPGADVHVSEIFWMGEGDLHANVVSAVVRLVLKIHHCEGPGDVLVFLPSDKDADNALELLAREAVRQPSASMNLIHLHSEQAEGASRLYEALPAHRNKVLPRRVVLTTAAAESAFSFDGIVFVIDSGLEMRKVYNPRIRAESSVIRPISLNQAEARRLRASAGCTRGPPGRCFRLYPNEAMSKMPAVSPAAILESNLTGVVLLLKRLDVAGMGQCNFVEQPAPEALMSALEELDYLGALNDGGQLSEIGIVMSEFPLPPPLSRSLLASCAYDCSAHLLTLTAMLTGPPCWTVGRGGIQKEATTVATRRFHHPCGDHFMLLNVYNAYTEAGGSAAWCRARGLNHDALRQVEASRAALQETMRRIELPVGGLSDPVDPDSILRALLAGYFMQVARDVDGSGNYLLVPYKHVAQLHPLSCYHGGRNMPVGHNVPAAPSSFPSWVVYHKFSPAEGNWLHVVSEIKPEILVQLAPPYYLSNLPAGESRELLEEIRAQVRPVMQEECCTTYAPQESKIEGDEGSDRRSSTQEDKDEGCILQ